MTDIQALGRVRTHSSKRASADDVSFKTPAAFLVTISNVVAARAGVRPSLFSSDRAAASGSSLPAPESILRSAVASRGVLLTCLGWMCEIEPQRRPRPAGCLNNTVERRRSRQPVSHRLCIRISAALVARRSHNSTAVPSCFGPMSIREFLVRRVGRGRKVTS